MTDTNHHLTDRMAARLFGIFFIVTFLSYGGGSGIIETITATPGFPADVQANKSLLVLGVILMAIVHTALNIGLSVLMLTVLKPWSPSLAYGYFGMAIAATTTLVIGAIFLLLLIPLSETSGTGDASPYIDTSALLLKKAAYYAYQLGMAIWGIGGLLFCALLYKSARVSRLLVLWGGAGYAIFITGTILELYGLNIGVILSIPGGLFEISLSLLLIFKGFRPSTIPPLASSLKRT